MSVLEQSIASCLGASHVITAASGTTTLHLALVASVIGAGGEVIVPSFSYIATANVVELVVHIRLRRYRYRDILY